jgi:hypothetical protein
MVTIDDQNSGRFKTDEVGVQVTINGKVYETVDWHRITDGDLRCTTLRAMQGHPDVCHSCALLPAAGRFDSPGSSPCVCAPGAGTLLVPAEWAPIIKIVTPLSVTSNR